MNNTAPDYSADITRHIIYVIQGIVLVISNGLLFGTIARHQALREEKEYVIVCALALSDAISGMGTLAAGCWRLPKLLDNTYLSPSSRYVCFFSPHNLLWVFANPLSALLILVTSVDRLLLVCVPLRYISWGHGYAVGFVGVAYIFCSVQFLYFGYSVWDSHQLDVKARCFSGESAMPTHFTFYQTTSLWATCLSIVMYLALITVNRHRINSVMPDSMASAQSDKLKRQKKMTRTLFLSCACDLVFYAVPNGILWVVANYYYDSPINNWLGPSMWIVQGFNPTMNLFIFLKKQPEMRKGLRALLKCKTLPPTLENWHVAPTPIRSVKSIQPTHQDIG